MTYNEILSRFTVKRKYDDRAQCICPSHDDREASLTISKGNKGTVLYCHAGCASQDVLEAVGLKYADLFEEDLASNGEKWKSYVEGREKRKIDDVYPYIYISGQHAGQYAFTRIRLSGKKFIYGTMDGDQFRYGLNGKHRKDIPAVYCGSLNRLNTAIKSGQTIFYCEGEKDVKTMESNGFTAVTCGAVRDWTKDCATLFEGAEVVILADNDDAGKESARVIEKDLQQVAKSVRIVVPTPEIEHGDISDYFKDHTVSDFEDLLNAPEELNLDQFHSINEKGRITGVYDEAIFQYLKKREKILIVGNVPYIYIDGVFCRDYSGAILKTMIRELIYPEFVKSTTIKRVYDLFFSDIELQRSPDSLNLQPLEWINFRNGFYDAKKKILIPHDPKYLATNIIPHVFDPNRGVKGQMLEKWFSFICEDPNDLEMLLQFCGLTLTRDCRQQKFLVVLGFGGTGKSVLIRLIDLAVGAENTSNISLHQLSQRFSAIQLVGKLCNSCADLEIDALSDTSTLKKVLGEDTFSAEYKGKDAVSVRSYAKLIFSTNQLPIVKGELTNGFFRRLLILQMNNIPEERDPELFDKLAEEIDDFIWLSVKALERMYEAGQIVESAGSLEAVSRLRNDSDTVEAFLTHRIQKLPNGKEKKLDLFRDYQTYCLDMERQSLTKQNFYRAMKAKGFSEVKSNGSEYFRGLEFLPKESLQKSLYDWNDVP